MTTALEKICIVCDETLDADGRCRGCFNLKPSDIEGARWQVINWGICSIHGAFEASGRPNGRTVKGKDPKDKRRVTRSTEWYWPCPSCPPIGGKGVVTAHKDRNLRREEDWQDDILGREARFAASKIKGGQ